MAISVLTDKQKYSEAFEKAILCWTELLGHSSVNRDPSTLLRYGTSCEPTSCEALAVLFPENVSQVQEIVRIAGKFSIPLYPISRGKNWGYGSACPASAANVIVDLRNLNRIIEVNEELAYCVIEPGVTQDQLHRFLEDNNVQLMFDATGAMPDTSIVGNLVERGFGQSAYGDRFLNCSSLEVVLSDGSLLRTGFGHFPEAKAASLYRWGIGPSLDGLFTQANFGIVTRVALWLLPKAETGGVFFIRLDNDQELTKAISRLRSLKLRGVLKNALHIANDIRVLSVFEQYPYQAMNKQTPLDPSLQLKLCKKWNIAPWNAIGGIYGTKADVQYTLKELRSSLRGISRVWFVSESFSKILLRFQPLSKLLTGSDFKNLAGICGLMRGKPSVAPTKATYWRKKYLPPEDNYNPARDQCGIIWCSPVIPMTGTDISAFTAMTDKILKRFSFETNIAITLINERACCCTVGIYYDKEIPEENSRAYACYSTMLETYFHHGYIPYRFGSSTEIAKNTLFNTEDTFWKTCHLIKNALDPKHILAPGRYGIP